VRKLAFAPLLVGLAALIVGLVFHSDFLGTIGFVLVALSIAGFAGFAAWRSKVAEARLLVAIDDAINRDEDKRPDR